ncbi:2-oxoglutarate and iron-dependent oxygenase JMJD4 homolog [Culicoides brevitarsis]|uniref:2-oxoglutarate and iron-dependent oxygenase JMJD4 homolog n=1 Tax=Culicoides brevitarsis TaxID=469753 RepID=UPI00307C937D
MENSRKIRISGTEIHSEPFCDYEKWSEIPKESSDTLSYSDFFSKYMTRNLPVIISLDLSQWDSFNNWISPDRTSLNVEYLKSRLGNLPEVPIAKCEEQYFDSHRKIQMSFDDFLTYWKSRDAEKPPTELLYLKDWHLRHELPDYNFYHVPEYFSSDFLNEYLVDTQQDDYKFVYIGPAGSYTPFHADVFSSFSWSVNIFGRKTWIFVPPGEEKKLKDKFGSLPFTIDVEILREKNVKYFVVTQETGNAIFVPSNWHHQVTNEVDTVSINHNWFNGANLKAIYDALKACEESCRKEISDCSDMEGFDQQCQVMVKSLFGMDYEGFLKILSHIVEKRAKMLENDEISTSCDEFVFDESHLKYDLDRISAVLKQMSDEKLLLDLNLKSFCDKILQKAQKILS